MSKIERREFLKLMGLTGVAGATASTFPWLMQQAEAAKSVDAAFYQVPMSGNARILHTTDVHGQLKPVYFREPNVNLGFGDAFGRPPHIVGKKLLAKMNLSPGGIEAHAYTYLDFDEAAKRYGRMGGFAHVKSLLEMLRKEAGGRGNTLTVDGGDLWQGSGTSLWTRGVDMVEASNILGVDVMVGHWEFTYRENEVLNNVSLFKGDFIGQNVRVKEEALMSDDYMTMVEKYDGRGLYDEDSGHAFQPYVLKEVGGKRIAVVGQAFPRTANANPPEFFPDWSFGLREDDLRDLVKNVRQEHNPDAVILVSHNGMDVDLKMASQVAGIDAIFGGHTHDGMPEPVKVKTPDGGTCLVTNAGSNGKYVGVMDFDIQDGKVKNANYKMLPVFADLLPADKEMEAYITQMRQTKYTDKVVESRANDRFYNKTRLGKTYEEILSEKLAIADRTLFRRGNFMGTWDQVLVNALRDHYKADIALSAGVRWGTSTLKGDWITMEDVMTQCSMTYGETYVTEMTGHDILNMLEQVADNLFDLNPYLQSGGDMVRVGGMDYTIEPAKPLYERITEARLDNGHLIEADQKYTVAGWATVNRIPDGPLMWDVVRDYILRARGKDNVLVIPKVNDPVLVGVSGNPGIADYQGKMA